MCRRRFELSPALICTINKTDLLLDLVKDNIFLYSKMRFRKYLNWYTTLLNAHGNPMKHFGDLDGKMTQLKLPQKGAIKRFIKA